MGEKDIAEKRLLLHDDIFASIWNVGMFHGDEVIRPDELTDVLPRSTYKAGGKLHEQERDIAKLWKDSELRLALLGVENQTDIDRTMPLRVIGYDGAAYRSELSAKPVKMYPVFTVVLYFGWEQRWKKPIRLKDCFTVPEKMQSFFSDYKIHVINVAWLPDRVIAQLSNPFRQVAEYFSYLRKGKKYQPKDENVRYAEEFLDLMKTLTRDNRFEAAKKNVKEGESMTMRSILLDQLEDEARAKGEAEGRAKGEAEGRAEGRTEGRTEGETQEKHNTILRMLRKGWKLDVIADATDWTVGEIEAWLKTQHPQPAQ